MPPAFEATIRPFIEAFDKQATFAATYAPLNGQIYGTIADWLRADEADTDPLVAWLLKAAADRAPFDATNLVAAALHREILRGNSATDALRPYYRSVGGTQSPHSPAFQRALRASLLACSDQITPFIQQATVQTNETSRGLAWLLPALCLPHAALHLVDLGASAGLNMLANERHFQCRDEAGQLLLNYEPAMLAAHARTFTAVCRGATSSLNQLVDRAVPQIVSRIGADLNPVALQTDDDALTLMSYVWADHEERLLRLQEAIGIARQLGEQDARLQVEQCHLPDGLEAFLQVHVPQDGVPVLIYNTIMTPYLADDGASLRERIGRWVQAGGGGNRPVYWAQLETTPDAPELYWAALTVDRWHNGDYQRWQLAWAHPHVTHIEWLPDLNQFLQDINI